MTISQQTIVPLKLRLDLDLGGQRQWQSKVADGDAAAALLRRRPSRLGLGQQRLVHLQKPRVVSVVDRVQEEELREDEFADICQSSCKWSTGAP